MKESTYDDIPYQSLPISTSHPSRMAAIARLFSVPAEDPASCRLIELGCASGGNIIPMALSYPDSKFVGVDLSERQISEAKRQVAALGLTNIEFIQADIDELDITNLGKFDFFVAHGVFSWISQALQSSFLTLVRGVLSPNGIALISYNTYPGWHVKNIVREMMLYHTRTIDDPDEKISQALAALGLFSKAARLRENDPYGALLTKEVETIGQKTRNYLFHDYLEEHNIPLYFHEFAKRVEDVGLRYLGDSVLTSMFRSEVGEEVAEKLKDISVVHREQYLDFVTNRAFRSSLLCQNEVKPNWQVDVRKLFDLEVGLVSPVEIQSGRGAREEALEIVANGRKISLNNALTREGILTLHDEFPRKVSFQKVFDEAKSKLRLDHLTLEGPECAQLATDLMELVVGGVLDIAVSSPAFVITVDDKPTASYLARWQSAQGNIVSTRLHQSLQLDDLSQLILPMLDGSRDKLSIVDEVTEVIRAAEGTVLVKGEPVRAQDIDSKTISLLVEELLGYFAKNALFVKE